MKMFQKALALAAAASMVATPVMAQSAASPPSAAPVQRAGPNVDGNELAGGNIFVPALAALIILLGILTATGVLFGDDDDEDPVSP
jgi:ABC-type amino acid transport system permease subunit